MLRKGEAPVNEDVSEGFPGLVQLAQRSSRRLLGLVGLSLAREEGLELNLLGLTFGFDPLDLALKLPGIGRLGPA